MISTPWSAMQNFNQILKNPTNHGFLIKDLSQLYTLHQQKLNQINHITYDFMKQKYASL